MKAQPSTPGFWPFFTLMFGTMAVIIVLFSYAFYQEEKKGEQQRMIARDLHHVEIQRAILTDSLTNAFYALAFIVDQVRLHRPFSDPEGRLQLEADFTSFLKTIPAFDQVRLLDMRGREFIRANQTRAGPHLVPTNELQDKSGRDYFRETMRLATGHIYLSALDLNMEHGEVERPLKPVIRLAMPAFEGGHRTGVIVLNLKMANVLANLQRVSHTGESESYLLNLDGFFLSSPHAAWNWGSLLAERRTKSFVAMFPEAWRRMAGQRRGQFVAGGDLFSFAVVDLLEKTRGLPDHPAGVATRHHHCIIASRLSAASFELNMAQERRQYIVGTALLMLAAALLAGMLARFRVHSMKARAALWRSERWLSHLLSSSPAVIYSSKVSGNYAATYISENVCQQLGYEPEAFTGDPDFWAINIHPDDKERVFAELPKLFEHDQHVHEYRFRHSDGGWRWMRDNMKLVRDAEGTPQEIVGSWFDISDRKLAEEKAEAGLKEKEILLRELHHRVKNNMQIISSLLKLQAGHVGDEHLHDLYRESQQRIRTISMVHEQLYATNEMRYIDARNYVENIVYSLVRSHDAMARHIAVDVDITEISLSMDEAIPCGLIVNELVCNALKHAFAEEGGELGVSLTMQDDEHKLLRVYDSGCGLPPDMDIHAAETLGLQLVDSLAKQLGGECMIYCEHGTDVHILFPSATEVKT